MPEVRAVSAQPLRPPAVDADTIEALDFDPEYACEWTKHDGLCGAPAVLLYQMRKTCTCPNPVRAVCADCWAAVGRWDSTPGCWHCAGCRGHVGRTRDEAFAVVCYLKGGRS